MPHDDMITPDLLLKAYASGIFPMAEERTDAHLFWLDPDERGILPLDSFHIPRSLAKLVRRDTFTVTVDRSFRAVVQSCAASAEGRTSTWISHRVERLYTALHDLGHAHSVEVWRDDNLVGGLYGVSLGGAFFGESMFHKVRDASKVALVHLVARLITGGYRLLDTQFATDHLRRFGVVEIPRQDYQARLRDALDIDADFYRLPAGTKGASVLQRITQTS